MSSLSQESLLLAHAVVAEMVLEREVLEGWKMEMFQNNVTLPQINGLTELGRGNCALWVSKW